MTAHRLPYKNGRPSLDIQRARPHVACRYGDRLLLGEAYHLYYYDGPGPTYRLRVRHFNGQPWPFDPPYSAVLPLERDTTPANPIPVEEV